MRFLSRTPNHEQGCTLIELLVGVAILGLLTMLIAMTFSTTFRAIETIGDEREIDRQARICLALMVDELMMARPHPWFPFTGRDRELGGYAEDAMAFVSRSQEPSLEPTLQSSSIRVVYARDGDHVTRLALRNLYSVAPELVERVDMASGVLAFNLRYYDGAIEQWVNEWDGASNKSLPRAVMIELTLLDARNEAHMFSDWAIIPSRPL